MRHFELEDVRNAGFKFEVQLNIQQERLCAVLLSLTPGFSQVLMRADSISSEETTCVALPG